MAKKQRRTQPPWIAQGRGLHGAKSKPRKPDEVLHLPGGVTIIRTGRLVEMRTDRTPEQQAAVLQALRDSFPQLNEEVQLAVDTCETLIPQFDPVQLLQKAFFDVAQSHMGMETESSLGPEAGTAMRVLEYLQAAIVSLPPAAQQRMFSEVEWDTLATAVHKVYNVLSRDWLIAESAAHRDEHGGSPKFEDLRAWLFMVWFGVRGARYNVHERERMFRLLEVHEDELVKLYGVGAAQIADSTSEIVARLTKGHGEAFVTVRAIHAATFSDDNMAKVDFQEELSERELLQRLVEATGRRAELEAALARAFGLDIFDITDISAAPVFNALALECGADDSFFAGSEHRGWPLRSLPTWFKPFIRLNGRLFCFYPYFVDNLYRAISRDVRARDKRYETKWKDGQTAVSEHWAVEILEKLLPGVATTKSAYYVAADGTLCETDAILTVDELLVVVEVKGGALAYTDPTVDLDAHLKSIETLLVAPASQAERFVAALESAGELTLCTRERSPIRTIRRSDFRTVLRCAVTVDQVTQYVSVFASSYATDAVAKVTPTWCISLDDLLVHRDVFESPIRFYHFLQYRVRAYSAKKLHGWDELDQLGAYLSDNAYVDAFEAAPVDSVSGHGYRDELDRYFNEWWATGIRPAPPTQKLPNTLGAIIAALERDRPHGFLACGAELLNLDGDARKALGDFVDRAHLAAKTNGAPKVIDQSGPDLALFVHVFPEGTMLDDETRKCRDHSKALLVTGRHTTAWACEVELSSHGPVLRTNCLKLSVAEITPEERARLASVGAKIGETRLRRAMRDGYQPGRNDQCPCGSGKKFKKCHIGAMP